MRTNFIHGVWPNTEFLLGLLILNVPSIPVRANLGPPPFLTNFTDDYSLSNFSIMKLSVNESLVKEQLIITSPATDWYNHTVYVNPQGKLGFSSSSRFQTVTRTTSLVSTVVERLDGAESVVKISYYTRELTNSHRMAGVRIDPAVAGSDYQEVSGVLVFNVGQRLRVIDIHLFPQRTVHSSQPRMFQVILHSPSGQAELDPAASEANITIVEGVEAGRIWDIMSLVWSTTLKDVILEYALEQLDEEVVNEQLDISLSVVGDIIDRILEEGRKRSLSASVIHGIMSVFCKLMDPVRIDTQGSLHMASLYRKFASILLTNVPCPTTQFINLHDCPFSKIGAAFLYESQINGVEFHGLYKDNLKLPNDLFPNALNESTCRRILFIEYNSAKWFFKASDKPPLSNRILSINIEDKVSSQLESPVIFRIHTMDSRIAASHAECLYFDEKKDNWLGPQDGSCKLLQIVKDAVFCSCSYLSMYAARAELTMEHLVGYNFWFYGTSLLAIFGLALAVLAHHLCSIYSMFSAVLVMHMVFACLANQVVYFINAIVSPTILLDDSNLSCTILGFFQHFFFLAQFSWMFSQSINFWKILIRNDEHTHARYSYFFFLGWGTPAVIVSIFYIIAYNLYQHLFHLQDQNIYGDVHNNGQICFITNPYAALGGVIIPILVFLVIVSAVFLQAYQVSGQWQCFDDIYRGRYNGPELRILFIFWAIIMLTWFMGGLHLAYGHLWMLILFCLFNAFQGLYALIVYTILRNPRMPCLFRPTKATYTVNSIPGSISTEPLTHNPTVHHLNKPSISDQTWPRPTLSTGGMKIIRSPPSAIDPIMLFQSPGEKLPPMFVEPETKEFDDLIFALKTGSSFMAQTVITHHKTEQPNLDPDVSIFSSDIHNPDITYDTHL